MNIADMVPPKTMMKLDRLRKTVTLSVLMRIAPINRPKAVTIAMIVANDISHP